MNAPLAPAPSTGSIKTLQVLNIIGYILMVVMNYLAVALPLNGNTTGELSDKYANLFVPSGATFSIWGVIYLLLLVYTIYQASTLFSSKPSLVNRIVSQVGIWYFVSSLCNSAWIVAWHYEVLPLSVVIMLGILLSLLFVNLSIRNISKDLPRKETFLTKAPFGVYLGWICVAAIANLTAWLTALQWSSGLEQDTWTVIMIVIGGLIVLFAALRLRNGYIAAAVVWAFAGIITKRLDSTPLYYSIAFVAGALAVTLFIYAVLAIVRDFNKVVAAVPAPTDLYE